MPSWDLYKVMIGNDTVLATFVVKGDALRFIERNTEYEGMYILDMKGNILKLKTDAQIKREEKNKKIIKDMQVGIKKTTYQPKPNW